MGKRHFKLSEQNKQKAAGPYQHCSVLYIMNRGETLKQNGVRKSGKGFAEAFLKHRVNFITDRKGAVEKGLGCR